MVRARGEQGTRIKPNGSIMLWSQILLVRQILFAYQLFDAMAARTKVLNFAKIFGGVVGPKLEHLWLLGIVKLNSFEWFLKKWDLCTYT